MNTNSCRISETRTRLHNVSRLYDDYITAKKRAEEYSRTISYAKTAKFHDIPKPSRTMNSTEDRLIKSLTYSEEADKCRKKYLDYSAKIEEQIKMLPDSVEKRLLQLRYIDFKNWSEIIDILSYDRSWVYRLHNRAIENLDNLLNNEKAT